MSKHIGFTCPDRGGHTWGTSNATEPHEKWIGHCHEDGCTFEWKREDDDKYINEDDTEYWDSGHPKPPKHIVTAANRFGEVIIVGARHWDKRMRQQAEMMGGIKHLRSLGKEEQGFIDQFGNYHSREDAMKIVISNGQRFDKKRNGGGTSALFSEGLH